MLDRSKDEIARDILERGARLWGSERAEAMKEDAEKIAESVAVIMKRSLPLDGAEPDFLVAPAQTREGE